ncbi:hypothetical protein [Microbacterium sp. EST19A]|nr:hypothetical protein [Microbacterium sp. EST19A]
MKHVGNHVPARGEGTHALLTGTHPGIPHSMNLASPRLDTTGQIS